MARTTTTRKTATCTRCKQRRKLDLFYRDKHQKSGHSSWCKACEAAYAAEYRARKNAERSA
jgi:hypothetical protein